MLLARMTWPEVKALDFTRLVVLAPLGAFEQHGPHLPFTTDTDIVTALALALEGKLSDRVLCLPALWTGHSTHHLAFPGTLSIGQGHYVDLIRELVRSCVNMGARRVFLLNGHGGNDVPVRAAMREVKSESPDLQVVFASYWMLAAQSIREIRESGLGGVSHACEMETSLMLHLHPERVRLELARRDGPSHPSPYRKADMQLAKPVYYVSEFDELSASGVIGHPDLATAEKGARFYEAIVTDLAKFLEDFLTW
ncbi:MAG: creatininase family protein [Acidobacteria bacterium]|nr:creatininase family protein [Acidobacteriota bacterium]